MENSTDTLPEETILTDKDIFTKIWISPRMVFKSINDKRYNKFITVLLILGGIQSALNRAMNMNMGDRMNLISVLIVCVIGGGIFGFLCFYLFAVLLSWTGRWLKGKGNTKSLLRLISYALIPSMVVLFLMIIRIVLFGNDEFKSNVDLFDNGILFTIITLFSILVEIGIGVWTLVILVIGTSEVQKLSIGKAILNLILPVIVICAVFIPVGAIAFIAENLLK
jgi:hypothetical protein